MPRVRSASARLIPSASRMRVRSRSTKSPAAALLPMHGSPNRSALLTGEHDDAQRMRQPHLILDQQAHQLQGADDTYDAIESATVIDAVEV